jgi:hypothetical protein
MSTPMDIDVPPLPGKPPEGDSFIDRLERKALAEAGIEPAGEPSPKVPSIAKEKPEKQEKQEKEKRPQPRTPSPPRKRIFRKQPTFTLDIDITGEFRGGEFSILVSLTLFCTWIPSKTSY